MENMSCWTDKMLATTIAEHPCIHEWFMLHSGSSVCRHCEIEVNTRIMELILKHQEAKEPR